MVVKKYLKIFSIFVFLFFIFISFKVSAKNESFSPYNYLVQVTDKEEGQVEVNVLVDYETGEYIGRKYIDSTHYTGVNAWSFDGVYLIYGIINNNFIEPIEPYYSVELSQYIIQNNSSNYQEGYNVASDYYNNYYLNYYNDELELISDNYNNDLTELESYYLNVIDTKDQTISQLQDTISSTSTPWGSFTSLLGTIFLFPIKLIKESLDINLFGINLAAIIIGIFTLTIIISIVLIIFRRKKE